MEIVSATPKITDSAYQLPWIVLSETASKFLKDRLVRVLYSICKLDISANLVFPLCFDTLL
jgi:hypothetical protein